MTRIVTHPANTQVYSAIRFGYAFDGHTVSFVAGESWQWDGNPANCPTGYNIAWAREFRYDSGRARYLNRVLDVSSNGLMHVPPIFAALSTTWTDYDGDTSYGDYSLAGSPPTATNLRSYEPGIGQVDPWVASGDDGTKYGMSDLLGTERGFTDNTGFPGAPAVYTAFGEIVYEGGGVHHRYGYVGAWGYQQHAEFPFLHVGERYYDPASGRFLQRDPIGIRGGPNVYAYVENMPTSGIDPDGDCYWWLPDSWWPNKGIIRYGPERVPINARRSVTRIAFRYMNGAIRIFGWRGLGVFGGLVGVSGGAGIVAGRVIDNTSGSYNNGFRISDGLGDLLYHWIYDDGSPYDPWGLCN